MRKRLMMALAAGALVAAMLPGVAVADPDCARAAGPHTVVEPVRPGFQAGGSQSTVVCLPDHANYHAK